jgi:hypothetical protein
MPISRDYFQWAAAMLRWVLGAGADPPPAASR